MTPCPGYLRRRDRSHGQVGAVSSGRPTLSYDQIDGIFGPVTRTAAGQFQRGSYLTVDGVPGRRMSRLAGDARCPGRSRSAAAPPLPVLPPAP